MNLKNWNDIPKQPFHETAYRQVFNGEKAMMVLNTIKPGFPPFPHSHPHEQLLYIIQGHCEVDVGDETTLMGPGDVVHIPSGVFHDLRVLGDETVLNLDIFSPIREDYVLKD